MERIVERFNHFEGLLGSLELVSAFFLVLIVLESVWDLVSGRRQFAETGANFAIGLVNYLLERTAYGLVFVIPLFVVEAFVPWRLGIAWWTWPLSLLAADLTYYWMHRWEHEVRLLWSYHSVHHSSPEYNLSTSVRLAWVEGAVEWVFFVPMLLLGFDVVQTVLAIAVVVAYQTWIHTERVGKLGWLDRWLNTPSVHRVHHGANERYLDRNYGGVLIIWDRLFGTYQAEEEPVVFGITKPLRSSNPLVINFHELVAIFRDAWSASRWSHVFLHIFGHPAWRPPPDVDDGQGS